MLKRDGHLEWLQNWYLSNCDGDWEHQFGIKIETLDNPGWSLTIDLDDTLYEEKGFDKIFVDRSKDNWVSCKVESSKFIAACGPLNLLEVIEVFYEWITMPSEES